MNKTIYRGSTDAFRVEHVIDYNARKVAAWHRATGEWNPRQGGMPQLAFYCYFTRRGIYRMTGYVASNDTRSVWRRTKHEAIKAFTESYV